jgi:hypothetical protein
MIKLLSKLNIGDTININSMTIHKHSSWITSTKRWLYGENRNKTIIEVENSIMETLYSLYMNFNVEIYNELILSMKGLQSLYLTYKEDDVFKCRIINCINLIEKYKYGVEMAWNGDSVRLDEFNIILNRVYKDRKEMRESNRYMEESSEKWNIFINKVYDIFSKKVYNVSSRYIQNELTNTNNQRKILKYFAPIVIKKMIFPNVGDNMMFLLAFKLIFNHIV